MPCLPEKIFPKHLSSLQISCPEDEGEPDKMVTVLSGSGLLPEYQQ